MRFPDPLSTLGVVATASAVVAVLLILALPAAGADVPQLPNVDENGVILDGHDPVAFFTEGRPVKGSAGLRSTYRGAIYQFASQRNRETFDADPAKYEPQFGGWCAYAVSQGRTAPIQVETWSIVEGRLVLQHNAKAVRLWEADPVKFLHLADRYWPAVVANGGRQIDVEAE
jgi:YHS domain-containing protein